MPLTPSESVHCYFPFPPMLTEDSIILCLSLVSFMNKERIHLKGRWMHRLWNIFYFRGPWLMSKEKYSDLSWFALKEKENGGLNILWLLFRVFQWAISSRKISVVSHCTLYKLLFIHWWYIYTYSSYSVSISVGISIGWPLSSDIHIPPVWHFSSETGIGRGIP